MKTRNLAALAALLVLTSACATGAEPDSSSRKKPFPQLYEVSVRTTTRFISGSSCDPESVMLVAHPQGQVGIFEARCTTISITPQTPAPVDVGTAATEVRLGGEVFTRCRLETEQRNHYESTLYSAWGFHCEEAGR